MEPLSDYALPVASVIFFGEHARSGITRSREGGDLHRPKSSSLKRGGCFKTIASADWPLSSAELARLPPGFEEHNAVDRERFKKLQQRVARSNV